MEFVLIFIAALVIGVFIGVTGIGGGALTTPALLLLGVHPSVAVANDLVAAAFSKSLGAGIHWRKGTPHMGLVKWLVVGSVPGAVAGSFLVASIGTIQKQEAFLKLAIGVALLIAAAAYTFRAYFTEYRSLDTGKEPRAVNPHPRPIPTIIVGVIGGLLVGITSVGAGSVIMVALLLLYPGMKALRLVSTDLVQAVPLVIAAALAHIITNGIQWAVFIPLVIGSTLGTFIGSHLAFKVNQSVVRRTLGAVLIMAGSSTLGIKPLIAVGLSIAALLIGRPLLRLPILARQRQLAAEL
jgi:uncharacterized membrane protein YfcA